MSTADLLFSFVGGLQPFIRLVEAFGRRLGNGALSDFLSSPQLGQRMKAWAEQVHFVAYVLALCGMQAAGPDAECTLPGSDDDHLKLLLHSELTPDGVDGILESLLDALAEEGLSQLSKEVAGAAAMAAQMADVVRQQRRLGLGQGQGQTGTHSGPMPGSPKGSSFLNKASSRASVDSRANSSGAVGMLGSKRAGPGPVLQQSLRPPSLSQPHGAVRSAPLEQAADGIANWPQQLPDGLESGLTLSPSGAGRSRTAISSESLQGRRPLSEDMNQPAQLLPSGGELECGEGQQSELLDPMMIAPGNGSSRGATHLHQQQPQQQHRTSSRPRSTNLVRISSSGLGGGGGGGNGGVVLKMGGSEIVNAVLAGLHNRVISDPALSPFFVETAAQRMLRQVKFLSTLLNGRLAEEHSSLHVMHRRLIESKGLQLSHFDRLAQLFLDSLTECGVVVLVVHEAMLALLETRPVFDPDGHDSEEEVGMEDDGPLHHVLGSGHLSGKTQAESTVASNGKRSSVQLLPGRHSPLSNSHVSRMDTGRASKGSFGAPSTPAGGSRCPYPHGKGCGEDGGAQGLENGGQPACGCAVM